MLNEIRVLRPRGRVQRLRLMGEIRRGARMLAVGETRAALLALPRGWFYVG